MTDASPILALDLGGTGLRVALVDRRGAIVDRMREDTRSHEGPASVVERVVRTAKELLAKHGVEGPIAMGAAVASPQDNEGVVHNPPNLKGWEVVPLRAMLEEALGAPVLMGNDANVAALGEQRFGAGQGVRDLIYMTVSTGVGGGVVSSGRLITGAHGFASEVGHIIIDREATTPFNCGHRGCLESLASGTAIAGRARAAVEAGQATAAERLAGGASEIKAQHVFAAAEQGDAYATALADSVARDLGLGILSLLHVFNPQRFVLGGGVALYNWPRLQPGVEAVLHGQALPGFLDDFELTLSRFGDDVGLVGAAALVLEAEG